MKNLETIIKKLLLSLLVSLTLFTADYTTVHEDYQENTAVSTCCEEYPELDHISSGF